MPVSTLESRGPGDGDRASLTGIVAGELQSLQNLYARHGVRAYSLALRLTGDAQSAESVVEAVFLAVWRNAASHRLDETGIAGWLAGLVEYRSLAGPTSLRTSPVASDSRVGRPEVMAMARVVGRRRR